MLEARDPSSSISKFSMKPTSFHPGKASWETTPSSASVSPRLSASPPHPPFASSGPLTCRDLGAYPPYSRTMNPEFEMGLSQGPSYISKDTGPYLTHLAGRAWPWLGADGRQQAEGTVWSRSHWWLSTVRSCNCPERVSTGNTGHAQGPENGAQGGVRHPPSAPVPGPHP